MKRSVALIVGLIASVSSPAIALPGAQGVSPIAGATVGSMPTFTWTAVGGATWYRVWANPVGQGANQLFCTDPFYGAGRVDPAGCWVQGGTTHIETKALTAGSWKWFVHAYSPGSPGTDWSPGYGFVVAPTPSFEMAQAAVHVFGGTTPVVSRSWNAMGGTPTVSRINVGIYRVKFPGFTNMSIRFWKGVLGAGNATSSTGYLTIQPLGSSLADSLYVQTFGAGGVPADQPFYIIVH